jgi:hypothetical protein
MKIITGLRAIATDAPSPLPFLHDARARALVDLALASDPAVSGAQGAHACDHFNVTYVLRWASHQLGGEYRRADIDAFMSNRLEHYVSHYFPRIGGFSFHLQKANRLYYQAPISRGRNEPDIHGTVLFLWGLSTLCALCGKGAANVLREHDA